MIVPLSLLALLPAAFAEQSHLVSRRTQTHGGLNKRFIDSQGFTNLSIIHTNDIHAHLDQFVRGGGDCKFGQTCFGGYARLKTEIDLLRSTRNNDSILLDAGDEFQGTLFYSTATNGSLISEVVNEIGYDVGTLGNHEFDDGEANLAAYIATLNYPITCANVQTQSNLSAQLVPYVLFPQHGLAVVSVLTPETKTIASPDESTNITDPTTAMQTTVDALLANSTSNNVTRIIALTHIGYDMDIELAKNTRNISLIVGGHSHTPLGNISGVTSAGEYPTIETNLDGDEVFIVTAYRWGYALGHIDVVYDQSNKIVSYSGGPITMTNTTAQDPAINATVNAAREPFRAFSEEVVGSTSVDLSNACYEGECSGGDVMCDAFIWYRNQTGVVVDGSIQNAGGVRSTISAGNITRGDVLTQFPFGNSAVDVVFTGQELVDTFEGIVSGQNLQTGEAIDGFVQIGGMAFVYNPNATVGQRLLSLNVGGSPVDVTRNYTIATIDFVAGGGDSFFEKPFQAVLDTQDQILTQYIQANSPIQAPIMGRITTSTSTERSVMASSNSTISASGSASSGVASASSAASAASTALSLLPSASVAAARLARWV